MYIEGWSVDGFGVFHDYEERGLPAGLCLFLGPNEAGKSTLLAFLRGVLFGFPARKAALHYSPQHGGRHGGKVFLGGAEGPITVEREVGTKAPRIIYPTEVELGDVAVRRLLGGVDDGLFRSVFAFSLAELADLASLSSAGVTERIFSAGIAGAGPIAGSVSKRLERDALELVRPRSGGLGNELLRRLGEADAAARVAARQAEGYPKLVEEEAGFGAEVELIRRAGNDADRRERRARLLGEAWPVYHDLRSARDEMRTLEETIGASGAEYRADDGLLALESRAAAAARTVELQQDRLGRLPELRILADGRGVALQRRLADLGADWNAERVRSFDASLPRQQEARSWSRALTDSAAGVDEARRIQSAAGDALVALDDPLREAEKELETLPMIASEALDTTDVAIRQLRADLQSLGLMDNDLRGRQAVFDDRRRQVRGAEVVATVAAPWGTVGLACLVASILLLVVAVWLAVTTTVAGGLAAAAGAVVMAAAATAVRGWAIRDGQRRQAATRDATDIQAEIDAMATEIDDLQERRRSCAAAITAAAAVVGLPVEPSFADVESRAAECTAQRRDATARGHAEQLLAGLLAQQESARAGLTRADAAVAAARAAHETAEEGWWVFREAAGLPAGVAADDAADLLRAIQAAQDALRDAEEVGRQHLEVLGMVDEWQAEARGLLAAADAASLEVQDAVAPAPDTPSGSGLVALVEQLAARCTRALQVRDEAAESLRALAERIRVREEDLAGRLGRGPAAEALLAELETGRLEDWTFEAERAAAEAVSAGDELETAIRAHHDAGQRRRALEDSADVAARQLTAEGVLADLGQVMRRWEVITAARALIDQTLADYRLTRQPPVLAEASRYLSQITGGAYDRVIEDDGEGFLVLDERGGTKSPDRLSRGTVEQLYLCLRLGLAAEFARGATSVPIIMDDVLVDFDPVRARATAAALLDFAAQHQVLFFTCHPHTIDLFHEVDRATPVRVLPRSGNGPVTASERP